jgi:hypothetical protein
VASAHAGRDVHTLCSAPSCEHHVPAHQREDSCEDDMPQQQNEGHVQQDEELRGRAGFVVLFHLGRAGGHQNPAPAIQSKDPVARTRCPGPARTRLHCARDRRICSLTSRPDYHGISEAKMPGPSVGSL